jgi:hypothetical protein
MLVEATRHAGIPRRPRQSSSKLDVDDLGWRRAGGRAGGGRVYLRRHPRNPRRVLSFVPHATRVDVLPAFERDLSCRFGRLSPGPLDTHALHRLLLWPGAFRSDGGGTSGSAQCAGLVHPHRGSAGPSDISHPGRQLLEMPPGRCAAGVPAEEPDRGARRPKGRRRGRAQSLTRAFGGMAGHHAPGRLLHQLPLGSRDRRHGGDCLREHPGDSGGV